MGKANNKKSDTKPIISAKPSKVNDDSPSVQTCPGPPIDGNISVIAPPAQGTFTITSIDGVIQNPANPWIRV